MRWALAKVPVEFGVVMLNLRKGEQLLLEIVSLSASLGKLGRVSFWGMNIGLAPMIVTNFCPGGVLQLARKSTRA